MNIRLTLFCLLSALTMLFSGCGKSSHLTIEELINKSELIYLAEYRMGDYYALEIIKISSTDLNLISEGQKVTLVRKLYPSPATAGKPLPHLVVVFVSDPKTNDLLLYGRLGPAQGNGSVSGIAGFKQIEVPLDETGHLAGYRMLYVDFVKTFRAKPKTSGQAGYDPEVKPKTSCL